MTEVLTSTIRHCTRCSGEFGVDTGECGWWLRKYCSVGCRKADQNEKRCLKAKMAKEIANFSGVNKCEHCDEPFLVDFEHRGQKYCPKPKTCAYDVQRGSTRVAARGGGRGLYQMSKDARQKLSESLLQGFRDGRSPTVLKHWRHLYKSATGREIVMRSKSEVLFAEQLDSAGVEWLYEPKKFNLGWTTYTPDFYLPALDRWIEVKGFWEEGSDSQKKFIEFSMSHRASVVWARDVLAFAVWQI